MLIIAFPIFYQKVGPFRSFNLLFANGIVASQISLDNPPPPPFNNYSLRADFFHLLRCLCEMQLTGCELPKVTCVNMHISPSFDSGRLFKKNAA